MEETADMVQSLLEDAPTPSRKFCLRKKRKMKKKKETILNLLLAEGSKEVDILTELGFDCTFHLYQS